MDAIVKLLFQAHMLKHVPRTGYQFLGCGHETVAEHSFQVGFIGWVMSQMHPEADPLRLLSMCLLHDLTEARTGDLNYVQKRYTRVDERRALADSTAELPFGAALEDLVTEFEAGLTLEARLARDADQLAFILDLRRLADRGHRTPHKWLPHVIGRLTTETGRALAQRIVETDSDAWWLDNYVDTRN